MYIKILIEVCGFSLWGGPRNFWCHLLPLDLIYFSFGCFKQENNWPHPWDVTQLIFFGFVLLGTPAQPETGVLSCHTHI